MNQSLLLHIVERLEGLAGKLPATIQKPILSEVTPLKELFLQQRPPRCLFWGSNRMPLPEVIYTLFATVASEQKTETPPESHKWRNLDLADRGRISILDAREADNFSSTQIQEELKRQGADVVFSMQDGESGRVPDKGEIENLVRCLDSSEKALGDVKIIGIVMSSTNATNARDQRNGEAGSAESVLGLQQTFDSEPRTRDRILRVFNFTSPANLDREARTLMSILARELPNQARIEMVRISRDREAQDEIAQILVKSTTAICTAIGAQPIPFADLPILTTLQLVMVSGIMYISGRERSWRAATEFVGALGANVGVGMLLREGTRAILKFFPGWTNVVCGIIAGAGTYGIGRAATVFFLDAVSLPEARRTYLASRKKSPRPALLGWKRPQTELARGK